MNFDDDPRVRMRDPALGFTVDRWWPFTGRTLWEVATKADAWKRWNWMRRREAACCLDNWKGLLTISQYKILGLLLEWWNDMIQPEHLGREARHLIATLCSEEHPEDLKEELQHSNRSRSRYHEQLWLIFFYEFWPERTWNDWYLGDHKIVSAWFETQRAMAMELAALQRVASACIDDLFMTALPNSPNKPQSREVLSSRLLELLAVSPGATLNPCPWLNTKRSLSGWPLYLWDVRKRRTIQRTEAENADYICISHTWGRFRVDKEPAKLPGVPWPVPYNRRFNVKKLPAILAKFLQTGYIWMDLLCIPQDRSESALTEIARQGEIFQNAKSVIAWVNDVHEWTSLRHTVRCCLYLYRYVDIDYCYGKDVASKLRRQYLSVPKDISPKEPLFSLPTSASHPWLTSLWTLQEVCLRPDMALCSRDWKPLLSSNSGIVSLDTLILFAINAIGEIRAHDPRPCMQGPRFPSNLHPTPPYSTNTKAVRKAIKAYERDEFPDVWMLMNTISKTQLWRVGSHSAAGTLSMAQRRQVSEKGSTRRAEAIMSAVGATSWLQDPRNQMKLNTKPTDLLFGLYPLAFIHELARKHPFSFYGAYDANLAYLENAVSLGHSFGLIAGGSLVVGSMMPFRVRDSTVSHAWEMITSSYRDLSVRLSTQDWRIRNDGSVLMTKVTVLQFDEEASESSEVSSMHAEWVAAPVPGEGAKLHYNTPIENRWGTQLRDWLHHFRPSTPNYAVCLTHPDLHINLEIASRGYGRKERGLQFCGILLKQVGNRDGMAVLTKLGSFMTCDPRSGYTVEADVAWLVI